MTENNGPVLKTRSGRFQVSIWRQDKTVPGRSDWGAERDVVMYRASVQHSKWNPLTREWENQSIWCSIEDLRSLVNALDQLNGAPGLGVPSDSEAVQIRPGK